MIKCISPVPSRGIHTSSTTGVLMRYFKIPLHEHHALPEVHGRERIDAPSIAPLPGMRPYPPGAKSCHGFPSSNGTGQRVRKRRLRDSWLLIPSMREHKRGPHPRRTASGGRLDARKNAIHVRPANVRDRQMEWPNSPECSGSQM
jgi:hypothetical protein